jgi:hypothetical protein
MRFRCKYLKTAIKSNTTKYQYESTCWTVLKKMLSRSRCWKKKSYHQKNFNCLHLMIHHNLNQNRLIILLQSRYRDFFLEKKLQTKKWFDFFEKINHWTKKRTFFFERKVFFIRIHWSYWMSSQKQKMLQWTCWYRKISTFE